jgi:hypothetical protein
MAAHLRPPMLCAACEAEAQQLAGFAMPDDRAIVDCAHAGKDQACLGIATIQNGLIISWTIEGPMAAADAKIALTMALQRFRRMGQGISDLAKASRVHTGRPLVAFIGPKS